ncbi:hypothetical protein BMS3Bbin12_00195 [bacterium BMS3Bbin12]|nr:hypothetical protein BMS3Abin12_00024 [bacterium BMS3Abin12]GBE47041.1 hypothetical protein BMS3Bbin12_00195 [bacterium BMS3Bbin12]GBE49446.1 hypothetical protein BMS3Bbin13_00365 [bacterium BMS3Bbin13]HDO33532.1 DUF4124 domain-containing protein [Chromatiales bacterium]
MGAHNLFAHTRSIPLLLAGLLLAAPASAAIYRWTDSSGVIHYSQTPPTSPERDVVRLPESGSDVGAVPVVAKPSGKSADRPAAKKPAQPAKKPGAKAPESPAQHAARCRKARKTLTLVRTHTRIRLHEANGKVRRMSEAQRQAKIQALEKELAKDCS